MRGISELAEKIRDGLFLASSRTYGEQYVEPFIRNLYSLNEPTTSDHDGVGEDGTRFEIKACKVLRKSENVKSAKSLFDRIIFENGNLEINRLVPFSEALTAEYLANVQNVKRDHFEVLIYVLLFSDCIKIFWANSSEIFTGNFKNWSDKHGRYDAPGKSGQFGITKATISWHLENHLKDTVTYAQVTGIFRKLSE